MDTCASDGYFNRWQPDSGNAVVHWPVKSKQPPITFTMTRTMTGDAYMWCCNRCGAITHTETYKRPDHNCLELTNPK